jgi:alkaline phosphatase D
VALAAVPVAGFATNRLLGRLIEYPFTLGVASGDPSPDGVVIWTRLARPMLSSDGALGMPARVVDVEWEVAADERFTRVEQRGSTAATPQLNHSVHVEVAGLRPGREYFYRFRVDGHLSPVGRTRTAPEPGSLAGPLTMCFGSCANYDAGFFTAYRRLAEDEPDLVLFLGDYLYEFPATFGKPRSHIGGEPLTLAEFRRRYTQYKLDADLQAAHAVAPWVVVFDDHEVQNNWADEVPSKPDPNFPTRRAAALQAYYENMPLRLVSIPRGIDMQLYRRLQWGDLATFHMLDTRQYRDDQACGGRRRSACAERLDPARSLLGVEQERWLLNGFQQSRARWDLLGQQVFFSQLDLTPGAERGFNTDGWDGYVANRDRMVSGWVNSPVRNLVVLTGDVHAHWAGEVHERFDDPSSPVVATELVTTSISSGGDGLVSRDDIAEVASENPHLRYHSSRRGYVRTRIARDELRVDYRQVPFISRRGAEVQTGASFVVLDGAPELNAI